MTILLRGAIAETAIVSMKSRMHYSLGMPAPSSADTFSMPNVVTKYTIANFFDTGKSTVTLFFRTRILRHRNTG